MAINLIRVYGHILDKGPTSSQSWAISGQRHLRYFRWCVAGYSLKPVWYHLMDSGDLGEPVYNSQELEDLYKESNGFLGQMELF